MGAGHPAAASFTRSHRLVCPATAVPDTARNPSARGVVTALLRRAGKSSPQARIIFHSKRPPIYKTKRPV